jgi:hypothetical protein
MIKKTLEFGSVGLQCKESRTHGYRVRDEKGLKKIIEIFNGKIQLIKRQKQFEEFVKGYNQMYKTTLEVVKSSNIISLEKAWIAGFAEAEGCYTVTVINRAEGRVQVQVRYIIAQEESEKEILEQIALLCGGKLSKLETKEKKDGTTRPAYKGYNMTVNLTYLGPVIEYNKKNPLKTKKRLSYNRWLKIYEKVIAQEHLKSREVVE